MDSDDGSTSPLPGQDEMSVNSMVSDVDSVSGIGRDLDEISILSESDCMDDFDGSEFGEWLQDECEIYDRDDYSLMDDEDWKQLEELYLLYKASGFDKTRRPKLQLQRKDWDVHYREEVITGIFQSSYHMTPERFNKLVTILGDDLQIDEAQSMRSTGGNDPIRPEIFLGATLRFINGGRVCDICRIYGISSGSGNRIIRRCIEAIVDNHHPLLAVCLPDPTNHTELYNLSRKWEKLSTSCGVIKGLVAAIDGGYQEQRNHVTSQIQVFTFPGITNATV